MAQITSNCSLDKNSGAILFPKSPELKQLKELRKEIKEMQSKLDCIIQYLIANNKSEKENLNE